MRVSRVFFTALLVLLTTAALSVTVLGPLFAQYDDERPELLPGLRGFNINLAPHTMMYIDVFTPGLSAFGWPGYVPRQDVQAIESILSDLGPITGADLYRLDTGAPVQYSDAVKAFDLQGTVVYPKGDSVEVQFNTAAPPPGLPVQYKLSFQLSPGLRFQRCGFCIALRHWLFGAPAHAQGVNYFAGPGFREDVIVVARVDGPGRTALRASVGGTERAIPGTVKVEGASVEIEMKFATLADLGVARAGVRAIFGVVGPPSMPVFDRIPNQGSIALGIASPTGSFDASVKAKLDIDGDGKPDLYYLDTNGNGLIDAAARDYNGDGRIEFMRGEGPFQYISADGRPIEFERVESRTVGKRQIYLVQNSSMAHVTLVDDKNGDGKIAGQDEFVGYFLPKR